MRWMSEQSRSKTTIERLRTATAEVAARLTAERDSHVLRLSTLATEACELQQELIKALTERIEILEVNNRNLLNDLEDSHEEQTRLEKQIAGLEVDLAVARGESVPESTTPSSTVTS